VAIKTVTATFNGTQESIDVAWSGLTPNVDIRASAVPSDGFGAVRPWLVNPYAGGATVKASALWSGTVKLLIADAPTLPALPSTFLVSDLISAADNVHGIVGPLATPLDNIIAMRPYPGTTSVQIQYANRVLAYPGALIPQPSGTITGCKLAVGPIAIDGQSWTGTPTIITGITLPTGGALYTSVAIDITGMANANGEIGVAWSVPTGQSFYGEQPGYFGYGATNEDLSGLTALVSVNINPLFVNALYRVPSTAKRRTLVGDSVTRSLSSTFGDTNGTYKQSLGWLLNARTGVVCNRAAGSGQTLQAWADQAGRPWLWDFEQWVGTTALNFLGINDVNGGARTSAQMLADLSTICDLQRAAGAYVIEAVTVPPSSTYSAGQNTTRTTYNTALLLKPYGISYVLDADAVLRNAGLPNQLQAAYACGDLLHLTAAANTALYNQYVADGRA
jgi:hypothetical protein